MSIGTLYMTLKNYASLHPISQDLMLETDKVNQIQLKTLVLVHPGSLFGSADFNLGYCADRHRDKIREQLLTHTGNLIVIDGFLSDEIDEDFDDAIDTGLVNAYRTAGYYSQLNLATGLRIWGCDAGEEPYSWWCAEGNLPNPVFERQEKAAEFLCGHITSREVEVTGAWATKHGRMGCVNSVADVLQNGLPDAKVNISETALFEEYRTGIDPLFPNVG